jgi:hypothetical protein
MCVYKLPLFTTLPYPLFSPFFNPFCNPFLNPSVLCDHGRDPRTRGSALATRTIVVVDPCWARGEQTCADTRTCSVGGKCSAAAAALEAALGSLLLSPGAPPAGGGGGGAAAAAAQAVAAPVSAAAAAAVAAAARPDVEPPLLQVGGRGRAWGGVGWLAMGEGGGWR